MSTYRRRSWQTDEEYADRLREVQRRTGRLRIVVDLPAHLGDWAAGLAALMGAHSVDAMCLGPSNLLYRLLVREAVASQVPPWDQEEPSEEPVSVPSKQAQPESGTADAPRLSVYDRLRSNPYRS